MSRYRGPKDRLSQATYSGQALGFDRLWSIVGCQEEHQIGLSGGLDDGRPGQDVDRPARGLKLQTHALVGHGGSLQNTNAKSMVILSLASRNSVVRLGLSAGPDQKKGAPSSDEAPVGFGASASGYFFMSIASGLNCSSDRSRLNWMSSKV